MSVEINILKKDSKIKCFALGNLIHVPYKETGMKNGVKAVITVTF